MARLLTQLTILSTLLGSTFANTIFQTAIVTNNQPHTQPTKLTRPTMGKDTLLSKAYIHCDPKKYGALVMDSETGEVILSYNPHQPLYPASMVKMMTTLLALEKLERGEWQENTVLKAQIFKSSTPGLANLGLRQNQSITVGDDIKATFIVSAADAAQTLAVAIAGSPENFVIQMNAKAKALGMNNTHFENAPGDKDHKLGPGKNAQVSTPYDMALLMKALWEKGQNYSHLLTVPTVSFGKYKEYTNHALKPELKTAGMVVGKTGYFKEAGCNMTGLFADNKITVLYGAYSNWDRAKHLLELKYAADNLVKTKKTQQKTIWPDIAPINSRGLDSSNFYQPPINRLARSGLNY